jgi:hypothetical protein
MKINELRLKLLQNSTYYNILTDFKSIHFLTVNV